MKDTAEFAAKIFWKEFPKKPAAQEDSYKQTRDAFPQVPRGRASTVIEALVC
jgi:hypothetical protein